MTRNFQKDFSCLFLLDDQDRSSSYDSLYNLSLKDLAGKKADYSHVQSKVRQYIHGGNGSGGQSRPSSRQQNFKSGVNDNYGKSFVLSPGRKSLRYVKY